MMLFKEKFLGDKDGAFARQNPKLFDGISKIVALFEEEQTNISTGFEEIKEQAKMVSVKSILQLRRTQYTAFHSAKKQSRAESQDSSSLPSNQISQLFAVDDTTPPLKEETLVKQAADEVPKFVYLLLGKPFVFCLHSEENTFVVSAPTKDALKAWVAAVNSAFNTFVLNQAKKTALMDDVWVVSSPDVWKTVNKLTANNASMDQVLGELFLLLLDQFEQQVVELQLMHHKRRVLQEWREAARIRKLQRVSISPLKI
ncbi:hypothetical protein BASA81_000965 [Batrachochytrium salamandrivorans]|nr:hypothetical protein BASA81_000965 [Batrachochytrium salamandrivorans]